jgi:glycosyltransferase involved in cell wall biosynthesis
LKVLQVYKDFYPPVIGGIEKHINILCKGLVENGIEVQVLVSNTRYKHEKEKFFGIPVHKAPQLGRFYSAPLTPSFYYYLQKLGKNSDIVHFHHPNPTAEFSYFYTNLKSKIVVTYHSDIIRQDKLGKIYSPFRKRFLDISDSIIATSQNYIRSSQILNQYKNKCTVIPLGIDVSRFDSDDDTDKVNEIKNEHGRLPLILFVGCLRYYKGLHILISAMKNISAKLIIIGSGPEQHRLEKLVGDFGLFNKIVLLGQKSDQEVNAYYKACDIFVLPSQLRSEAFGIVQLEAMYCKKPVISTELNTGTTFININSKTGLTINPNDIESLQRAIAFLINNPEKRKKFGENGITRVKELFTADKMVENIISLYKRILSVKTV